MSELESRELRDSIISGLNASFQKLVKEKKRTNSEMAFAQKGKIVKVKATKVTTSIITIGTQSIQPRLKAVVNLVKAHKAQVLNYLKAANSDVGLLINFGENSLKWERITGFEKKGQSIAADIVI